MASGNLFFSPLGFLILQLTFHFPISACLFPFSANLRSSDPKGVDGPTKGGKEAHTGELPTLPSQHPVPCLSHGRSRSINGDEDFLLDAQGLTDEKDKSGNDSRASGSDCSGKEGSLPSARAKGDDHQGSEVSTHHGFPETLGAREGRGGAAWKGNLASS